MIRRLTILIFLLLIVSVSFAQEYTLYKVKRKATVETVAFLNDISAEELLRANPTINPYAKIAAGTVVKIPVKKTISDVEPETELVEDSLANNVVNPEQQEIQPVVPYTFPKDTLIIYDSSSRSIRIAAVLPFEDSKLSQRMCEIYSGMLVAASNLSRTLGRDIDVKAYSTTDLSQAHLDDILSDIDIIVGPVYKESFDQVAAWALQHKKPIISPLMSFEVENNPYVIMMAPSQDSKDDPLKQYLSSACNVIMIDHSTYSDKAQSEDFLKIAPSAVRFAYSREEVTPQELMTLIDPTRLNVFLVPTEHQGAIEDVVSKITAINSPLKLCDLSIIGMSSWLNLSNFSQALLFRGNVSCVSSYYFDRQNLVMSSFFDNYINAFERVPSRFVLRGYDIVDIMTNALSMWDDKVMTKMDGEEFIPLMNPYRFERDSKTGNLCNKRWVLVTFLNNYSVDIR